MDFGVSDKISNPVSVIITDPVHVLLQLRSGFDGDMPQFLSKGLYTLHVIFLDGFIWSQSSCSIVIQSTALWTSFICHGGACQRLPLISKLQYFKYHFFIEKRMANSSVLPCTYVVLRALHAVQPLTAIHLEYKPREEACRQRLVLSFTGVHKC